MHKLGLTQDVHRQILSAARCAGFLLSMCGHIFVQLKLVCFQEYNSQEYSKLNRTHIFDQD